ncbi:MAG TPA: aminodeoxychorismate synthase component I [Solirubrobacteraceae bacterium]|nr:aminodeoxychorismate synthase component I [Solirubrobacteraceae bacterium]
MRVPLDCRMAPAEVLRALAGEPLPFALVGAWAGGGAIIGSDPVRVAADEEDPFALLGDLPPLTGTQHARGAVGGGWFGWLGYRLCARVERVPLHARRPVPLPDFHLAYYDNVLRRDPAGHWWFEALAGDHNRAALECRLRDVRDRLATGPGGAHPEGPAGALRLGAAQAAHHLDAVADCRRRIAAGEIFQANLCLRLDAPFTGSPTALLARALERVAPPYAAAFATPRGGIVSLSPELFLRRRGRDIVTGPIKGTIARADNAALAAGTLARLRASEKDAAEHVMIVDLMRNDLGRVCEYGSVTAPRRPAAEPHPGVWHLVSHVRGRLRAGADDAAVLRATFPPGSVTGAPKVQALKVIAALEHSGREVYTGAVGLASPVAGLELNVAIRTLELGGGRLWLGAGGGIVADSDPRTELEEALTKARPIAAAVGARVLAEPAPHHLHATP